MSYLSTKTIQLLDDFLPLISESTHRITNFLSFYVSSSGQHLYHSPRLAGSNTLSDVFHGTYESEFAPGVGLSGSVEHLLAKNLMAVHFHDHLMDEAGARRLMEGLMLLKKVNKEDIAEEFLRSSCQYGLDGDILVEKEIPPVQRRNVYVYTNK